MKSTIKEPDNRTALLIVFGICGLGFMGSLQGIMWFLAEATVPKPKPDILPINKTELIQELLVLNSEKTPILISNIGNIASIKYKIADEKWYEFFSKVHLSIDYQLQLYFIEKTHTVRAIEIRRKYRSSFGSQLNFAFLYLRGWSITLMQKEIGYGINSLFPLKIGTTYKIDFKSNVFRTPILEFLTSKGWKIEPCTLSLHLGI